MVKAILLGTFRMAIGCASYCGNFMHMQSTFGALRALDDTVQAIGGAGKHCSSKELQGVP